MSDIFSHYFSALGQEANKLFRRLTLMPVQPKRKLLTTPEAITSWLKSHTVGLDLNKLVIQPDLRVDYLNNLTLTGIIEEHYIPFNFGHIKGDFSCAELNLRTLKGGPRTVDGDYNCEDNILATLEGAPEHIQGNFLAYGNKLRTLKGAPRTIKGHFFVQENLIETTEGSPEKVGGILSLQQNCLTSLKGMTQQVGGSIFLQHNKIKNLEGLPHEVQGDLTLDNNKLTALTHMPRYIKGSFNVSANPLRDFTQFDFKCDGTMTLGFINEKGEPLDFTGHDHFPFPGLEEHYNEYKHFVISFNEFKNYLMYGELTESLPEKTTAVKKKKI